VNINTYIKFYFINLLNVGILFLINFVFSLFGTSQSGMWVVASSVLNLQPVIGDLAVNNIPTFFTPHNFANTSV